MKFPLALQPFKKCIYLSMAGVLSIVLASLIHVLDPVTRIVHAQIALAPNSPALELWRKPPIDVFINVYIFNITNPEEFMNGEAPLKVQEAGPYVYQEFLENQNVTFHENKTVSYSPKRTITFVPELSVGDPKLHLVSVPNIPFLGVTSALHNAGFLINYSLARLTSILDTQPILNITVHEFLWGYEDSLIRLASGIVPNFINFRKFGLLDRMYDEGENVILMNMNENSDMLNEEGRFLSIEKFNGMIGLSHWGYTEQEGNETYAGNTICNRIRGTTEGGVFPPYLDPRAVFRVYRKSFCRPIPIVFKERVQAEYGFEGFLYSTADDFLDPANPENDCYCRYTGTCLKKGLSDMTPCYYKIPAAMSLPHFLHGDPSLSWNIEGLNPDVERHKSRVILQPTLGVPMSVNSRMQINLVMHHTTYNSKVTPFNDMTLPLFWSDFSMPTIPEAMVTPMQLALKTGPMVVHLLICLLAFVGVTCLLLSIFTTVWVANQQPNRQTSKNRRESTELRIPLSHGQYSTIRILPAIKKITSKTELFT